MLQNTRHLTPAPDPRATTIDASRHLEIERHPSVAFVPAHAKWAFTTRRVPREDAHGLSTRFADAVPGDLLLAKTIAIGQHKKIQLSTGRGSENFVGDHVVLAVGDRYAPDQFEGAAQIDPADCSIIAGGGVAGRVTHANLAMDAPTAIEPLGLITDADGEVLNLASYALPHRTIPETTTVIGVFGTSMNSGKTTTAMSLAHGLRLAGHSVAGVKLTGTGAFGDYNAFEDAGVPVTDFVDAGMATTYRQPLERIERAFETLVGTAAADGADIVVVEIADGVFQQETAAIVERSRLRERFDGVLFASYDSAGAVGGVSTLRAAGLEPCALSGVLGCSPLGMREAEAATGLAVIGREALRDAHCSAALVRPLLRATGATESAPGGVRIACAA